MGHVSGYYVIINIANILANDSAKPEQYSFLCTIMIIFLNSRPVCILGLHVSSTAFDSSSALTLIQHVAYKF